jgi:glyoxylase-like metal-dependent hydrolase (beta-lactamase superfamily II)
MADGEISFSEPVPGVGVASIGVYGSTTNVYMLGRRDSYLLVDAGEASQASAFIGALEAQGYQSGRGAALIVTHGHADHYGGAAELASWAGAPVWAHVAAAVEVEDRWGGFVGAGSLRRADKAGEWDGCRAMGGSPVMVARLLREGDRLAVPGGGELEVMHMPGHQRGELVLFGRARRLAFVGDIIQGGCDAAGNWIGLISDPESQVASLARLRSLNPAWLFKGHRVARTGPDVARDIDAAAARVTNIEAALLKVLASGARLGLAGACRAVFREVLGQEVTELAPYAMVTIDAFLAWLSRRGLTWRDAELRWERDPGGP